MNNCQRIKESDVENYLSMMVQFVQGNTIATWQNQKYKVHSYMKLIFSYDSKTDKYTFDDTKYSQTTSKLQNKIKNIFGDKINAK